MIPDLGSILPLLESFYKKPGPSCPHCGWAEGCTKWCRYWRYEPGRDRRIAIQRYRCPNQGCPVSTFSVLPFGLLPFLRISFRALWFLVSLASIFSVNSQAGFFGCSRATIRRRTSWGQAFFLWFEEHLVLLRDQSWNGFCQLLFARFFPVAAARFLYQHNSANYSPEAGSVTSGTRR